MSSRSSGSTVALIPAGSDYPFLDGLSTYFMAINRNKRSIALDLKHPDSQEVVKRLLASADIVLENPTRHDEETPDLTRRVAGRSIRQLFTVQSVHSDIVVIHNGQVNLDMTLFYKAWVVFHLSRVRQTVRPQSGRINRRCRFGNECLLWHFARAHWALQYW